MLITYIYVHEMIDMPNGVWLWFKFSTISLENNRIKTTTLTIFITSRTKPNAYCCILQSHAWISKSISQKEMMNQLELCFCLHMRMERTQWRLFLSMANESLDAATWNLKGLHKYSAVLWRSSFVFNMASACKYIYIHYWEYTIPCRLMNFQVPFYYRYFCLDVFEHVFALQGTHNETAPHTRIAINR